MFRSLARNILITGIAYVIVSLVGLVLAPFLIATYGLAGYGQILLARIFLPSATFGFLDLGIGETATRAVAAANRNRDWHRASQTLTLLSAIALCVAIGIALGMVACAWRLPDWLSIAPPQRAGFTRIVLITAALQPAFFLSLVVEGVLKGFEDFRRARTCEVASAVIYGSLAVALGEKGAGPNWIAIALLIGLSARFLIAAISAIRLLRPEGVAITYWSKETWHDVMAWSRVMFFNKILGTTQTQAAAPLIGLLVGPAAVGAFDAVVRLPRFAKSILGLLNTTVLPVATGLKEASDAAALKRLGGYGTLIILLIGVPPLVYAMAYSRSLMHFWIGDQVIGFWYWQTLMFLVPIFAVALGFGGSILLADRRASGALNRLTMIQVVLQLAISVGFVRLIDQWSFALGQVVSVVLVFPFQFALVRRALGLDRRLVVQFASLAAISAVSAAGLHLLIPAPNLIVFIVLAFGYYAVIVSLAPWLLLDRDERAFAAMRLKLLLGARFNAVKRRPKPARGAE